MLIMAYSMAGLSGQTRIGDTTIAFSWDVPLTRSDGDGCATTSILLPFKIQRDDYLVKFETQWLIIHFESLAVSLAASESEPHRTGRLKDRPC